MPATVSAQIIFMLLLLTYCFPLLLSAVVVAVACCCQNTLLTLDPKMGCNTSTGNDTAS